MKRVLIIGGNGAGKSTLSRELGEILEIPVIHLDKLYWTDGWVPRGKPEFLELLRAELEKDSWILDGNMRSSLPERLGYCDTVIYLDYPGIVCFFGVLSRVIRNYGRTRVDMCEGCPERLDMKFLLGTLGFRRENRKKFLRQIGEAEGVRAIVLKSRRQARKFLDSVGVSGDKS